MLGSQKFSMKLPSRRKTGPSERRGNAPTGYDIPSYPHSSGQEKANKVLGTSRSSKSLHTKPSLVSITVSDVVNTAAGSSNITGQRLHPRPSSPLLGDRYAAASVSSSRNKSLKQYGSSSTLHSYYDPHKSPPSISQQTSESSARDYALRKGFSAAVPHRGVMPSQLPVTPTSRGNGAAPSKESKKKPHHIDISKLFPKHRTSSGPLLSPQRYTDSPSPLSTAGSDGYGTVISPSSHTSGTRLSKNPRAKDVHNTQAHRQIGTGPDPLLAKVNVKKPKPGVQNWFDALEDLSEGDENHEDSQLAERQQERQNYSKLPTSRYDQKPQSVRRTNSRVSEAGTIQVVLDVHSRERPSASQSPPSIPLSTKPQMSSQPLKDDTTRSVRSRATSNLSKYSHASTFKVADLKKESVLALSSSDEEDDGSEVEEPLRSPVLRDSVILHLHPESDVEVGTAQVVKTVNGPSVLSHGKQSVPISPRERLSRFSDLSTSTNGQSSPEIPERNSSRQLSQSNSMPSNAALQSSDPRKVENNEIRISLNSQSTRQDDAGPSRQSTTSSHHGDVGRTPSTRMMRVTRQEETLLAAMRLKKANMKRAILTEAYHTALEEEEEAALAALDAKIPSRPKTSGDNRTSLAESILDPDNHINAEFSRPRTAEGRQSIGPEDFALLRSAGAPPPPPSSYYQSQSDAATSSRRASTLPSDSLPSPTTSRASPVTPTISHIPPQLPVPIPSGRFSDNYVHQFPISDGAEEARFHLGSRRREQTLAKHNEKHTRQKADVQKAPQPHVRSILDDLDDAAEEAVNLDDFPMWAKSWDGDRHIAGDLTIVP